MSTVCSTFSSCTIVSTGDGDASSLGVVVGLQDGRRNCMTVNVMPNPILSNTVVASLASLVILFFTIVL